MIEHYFIASLLALLFCEALFTRFWRLQAKRWQSIAAGWEALHQLPNQSANTGKDGTP